MATLDYQRGEDHRDERRRERMRALGVVDYGAAWEAIARETGAEYLPTKWPLAPGKVLSRVGPWTLLLQAVGDRDGAYEMRLRADFLLLVPFRLLVRPFGLVDQLGEYLRLPRRTTGDPSFDANFVARSNCLETARLLLGRGQVRTIYRSFTDATFDIDAVAGWFWRRRRAGSAARVELRRPGVRTEPEVLGRMHALVVQTLEGLAELGIAASGD
jgi:hypothetical protein